MKVIKLDAIDSTNDFLKKLVQQQFVENYTVITANEQTKGKGQMGSTWNTEKGKNLITSILIKESVPNIEAIFNLNITIAVSIIEALNKQNINSLNIKWPNDIMAENKKIAGILIENNIKENGTIDSIIGIGLNINQTNFENLPKASSLKNVMNQDFDVDEILETLFIQIEKNIERLKNNETDSLWKEYDRYLFKKGKPTVFEDDNQERFMGIIQKVNSNGKLEVLFEDDSTKEFGIKEITMMY
ncbi:biotin--[acetyl-CoA-carboxylase] ligase [Flavobacterium sp.]|uniref:biotin--[acetyl-CoA-carboxylase] ligase n=1 Tax=Flavobacterium sp. TaxID=239 RepID=UPI002606D155|nr:biotin--[acetyl-CoA-carboxylase] ligase [Flavobacterium sp.]